MSYNFGHAGELQNSRECFATKPLPWKSALVNNYSERVNTHYNLRNNVRYDRNWGRSAFSNYGVLVANPMDVVDETKTPHLTAVKREFEYQFLPHYDETILPIKAWVKK